MTKYSIILGFFFLVILTGCQTIEQKAYEDLLEDGTVLIENDTVLAKVGTKIFYLYSYSAGVQDIYYNLKLNNSDSTVLRYVEEQHFYLGDEDMVGGPAKGIHILKGLKKGLVRLEFYNPYYNEMEYSKDYPDHGSSDRAIIEFYKTFTDSLALNNWTDAQYSNYYDNWSKLPMEARKEAVDTLIQKFQMIAPTIDTFQKTKIINSLAKRYAFRESRITSGVLDSLFNLPHVDGMERWQEALILSKKNLPVHENLKMTICYVKIED